MLNKIHKVFGRYVYRILKIVYPLFREIDNRIKPHWVIRRCMISDMRSYAYFRIPKCANSTIVKTLAFYDPTIKFVENDVTGFKNKGKFKRMMSSRTISLKAFEKKYFLFTFVRNPYSRVLSAYLDKIGHVDKTAYDKVRKRICNISDSNEISFKGFIMYLEREGLFADPHWAPQLSMIPIHVSRLDYIGHVENLNEGLNYIIKKLFGENNHIIYERIQGKTHASEKLKEYYDESLMKTIYGLYENDFKAFGYASGFNT